jgi:alkane 1-monooxygenase
MVATLWSINYATTTDLSPLQFMLMAYGVGNMGALGMVVSHEIMHKRGVFGKGLAIFQLTKQLYGHFYLEHVYGHHKWVATPNDTATAKLGQSFWAFLPQTIIGSLKSSWKREKEYLNKKKGIKTVYSPYNRLLQCFAAYAAMIFFHFYLFGTKGVLFYLISCAAGIFILEAVNYIRHYGLQRKELSPGVYEQVGIKHSWNAPQIMQNCFLLKLQRHSDHHANGYKPYQNLCSYSESPCLPMGYAVCVLAAMFPPVWFNIVDPLAIEANATGKPSVEQMKKSETTLRWFIAAQSVFMTTLLIIS